MSRSHQPKYISDERLIEWILDGSLIIKHLERRDPVLTFRGREIRAYLDADEWDGHNPRYRWCIYSHSVYRKACKCKKLCRHPTKRKRIRRTIARSKLVWMFKHRRVVTEGCLIHHRDTDRF